MMEMKILDWILVPMGLVVLLGYHGWLLHRIIHRPTTTVIGINSINRRFWVYFIMEDAKNGVLAVQTLRNNIMASTLLASTTIMMSSVMAVLMSPGRGQTGPNGQANLEVVIGDRSPLGSSIKFLSILLCFLVAFLLNVQSIRYYSHASILINVPYKKVRSPYLTVDYVARMVNRGSYFWSMGLRSFYFSFPLFLWVFGPIPMFASCVSLVWSLYFLDITSEFKVVEEVADCRGVGCFDIERPNRTIFKSRLALSLCLLCIIIEYGCN